MKNSIKLTVEIEPSVDESEITIRAKEETTLIKRIISLIRQCTEQERTPIEAYRENARKFISQLDIIRIYTADHRLVVMSREGEYTIRSTLKEIEETLFSDWFLRISRYEIINLNWVTGFDYSVKGTIKIIFDDGSCTWVSRRFIHSVDQKLENAGGTHHE